MSWTVFRGRGGRFACFFFGVGASDSGGVDSVTACLFLSSCTDQAAGSRTPPRQCHSSGSSCCHIRDYQDTIQEESSLVQTLCRADQGPEDQDSQSWQPNAESFLCACASACRSPTRRSCDFVNGRAKGDNSRKQAKGDNSTTQTSSGLFLGD